MQLRCGRGTSWWTIALFAATTSWTCVLNVRPTKLLLHPTNAQWPGESVTMLSTFTASPDGLRQDRYAHLTTVNGSSRSTVVNLKVPNIYKHFTSLLLCKKPLLYSCLKAPVVLYFAIFVTVGF
uniref:Uncharacterized protein n=1 Tax=Ciona savignyi TaxID=51511 RepID=H2YNH3_CIOSA